MKNPGGCPVYLHIEELKGSGYSQKVYLMQPMYSQIKLLGKCLSYSRQLKELQESLENSSQVIYHFHCFSNTLQKVSLESLLQATGTISRNNRNKHQFAPVQAEAPAIRLWNSAFLTTAKLIPVTLMLSRELL